MDSDIPFDLEPTGQFPYRHTYDDRFQYRVKVQPVAGTLEFSVRPIDTRLAAMAAERQWMGFPKRITPVDEARREEYSLRSHNRAKARIKLLCMEMGVDRMFTYTIRFVDKPLPYDTVLLAWDYYRRAVARYDQSFRYVATPEQQKNGQWHIHAGISGYANVNVHRQFWQRALNHVLGRDKSLTSKADSPGTVNVPPHREYRGSKITKSKKIACYVSKYVSKSLETEFNRKSYFQTAGVKITPSQAKWLEAKTRDSAVSEVLRAYGLVDDLGVPKMDIWNRDSVSAWFSVPIDGLPPPF